MLRTAEVAEYIASLARLAERVRTDTDEGVWIHQAIEQAIRECIKELLREHGPVPRRR